MIKFHSVILVCVYIIYSLAAGGHIISSLLRWHSVESLGRPSGGIDSFQVQATALLCDYICKAQDNSAVNLAACTSLLLKMDHPKKISARSSPYYTLARTHLQPEANLDMMAAEIQSIYAFYQPQKLPDLELTMRIYMGHLFQTRLPVLRSIWNQSKEIKLMLQDATLRQFLVIR